MYSLRDSIIKPDELVTRLKELGHNAVAITDHGTSLGGVSIYKTLKANNIKYIHGCEMYICGDVSIKDKKSKYSHLLVLCKNETGRINMNKLISISNKPENKYVKPRIDFNLLSQYGEGLIILSACLAGEVARALLGQDLTHARAIAEKYRKRFGNDFYLEIQASRSKDQIFVNKEIYKISTELNIPCVVTTDAHYIYESDKRYQNKYAFNGAYKEDGETYLDCFIQSENEVRERIDYLPEEFIDSVIENTDIIADQCNVTIPLSAPIMPEVDTPEKYHNNKEWLEDLCKDGFINKLGIDITRRDLDKDALKYLDRYKYELDSLDRMGFIDYILLVYTYANVADRRGIARGSGGGSLITYLTNITDIDPIEHGLYFERFIDVGALDLLESGEIAAGELKVPDIDLDFGSEACGQVLHFIYERYGESRVASIGKFGTNQTKGTIRDMCRVLEIDLETADMIAKSFEKYEIGDIDNMVSGTIPVTDSAKQAIYYVQNYTELFDYVRKLNGLPKSFGLHACGKIISTKDLDFYLPSSYDDKGIRYLQGDMHDVEDVGLVKIDVLGLRTVDQEYETLEMSGEDCDFIKTKQDYTDPKVLDIFRKGDTVGVFQMSSYGMKQTLKKMNVQGIEDLSIANALYRPGAMAYIDNFCRRRHGQEHYEYLHPDLEEILRSTYGIIVFQEQLIEIGRMAGMRNPDLLRRATAKKKPKLLNQVRPELESKLYARGWSEDQFNKLWSDMIEFSKYSFNKSHAAAYAIISYMTAKQKAYYIAEFYAGLCNSFIGKSDYIKTRVKEIVEDIERHSITFAKFDFRQDHRKCSVKNGQIIYAIPLIRECNKYVPVVLYEIRNDEFDNFYSFIKHLQSKKVSRRFIHILTMLGFFGEFGESNTLLRLYEMYEMLKFGKAVTLTVEKIQALNAHNFIGMYATNINKDGSVGKQYKIFDIAGLIAECEKYIRVNGGAEQSYREKVAYQNEYLGFINLTSNNKDDIRKLIILSVVPLMNERQKAPWAYRVNIKSIGSGKTASLTISKDVYVKNPIQELDIIYATSVGKNKKGYWYLWNYRKLNSARKKTD